MRIFKIVLVLATIFLNSCGSASFSKLFEEGPTEEDYQIFKKEIDHILKNHQKFAIKIINLPIVGGEDIEGDPQKLQTEVERIYELPVFNETEKFKDFWPRLWKEKGLEYRNHYIAEQNKVFGSQIGDLKTPLSFMNSPLANVRSFFSDKEINAAAEEIPHYSKDVRWDGVKERYIYTHQKDLIRLIKISGAIYDPSYRKFFRSYLDRKPEVSEKLRVNRKNSDQRTQFEPVDLVQSNMANFYINLSYFGSNGQSISPIVFQKLAHKSLFHFFKSSKEDDERGHELESFFIFRKLNSEDEFSVVCADGGQAEYFRKGLEMFGQYSFIKASSFKIFKLIENGTSDLEFKCAEKEYNVHIEGGEGPTIPSPKSYELEKYRNIDPVKIVVPFALTEELSAKARWIFHRYLRFYGFKHQGEKKNANTKNIFRRRAIEADIIVPVAHSLDVNTFHLGTKKSVISRYTRTFKNIHNGRTPVELDVFFPSKANGEKFERSVINTDDLAEIFHIRRQYKNTPLFIFNNSCFAENALWTWMKAYRKSANISLQAGEITDFSELTDVPHIFASKGGFPTSTTADVLSNVVYPFVAIETLAKGHKPGFLFDKLKNEDLLKKNKFVHFIRKFQAWRNKTKLEKTTFRPVYNAHFERLFAMNGYKILVWDMAIGESETIEY